jgi:hypothetical protein
MPPDLYAAIEGLQPYHGGKNDALALIHDLDNLDKHRFPPLVAGVGEIGSVHIGHFHGQITKQIRIGPVEHGAALFAGIPDPGSHVQMETEFRPSIAFGNSSSIRLGEPVYPLLYDALAFVQNTAFPALEPFL